MTREEYLSLITSEHRKQPKFEAMVSIGLEAPLQIQSLMTSMIPLFDIDNALGSQLDDIGKWVGLSRNITIPVPSVYLEWDGLASLGWEYGIWQKISDPGTITVLPDDVYKLFLRAKIAANAWDGTTEGAYAIWATVFSNSNILIQDNQDMSIRIAILGGIIDSLTLALLKGGYLPLKPEGVRIEGYITPVDANPFFGWDADTDFLTGWDVGSWGIETPTS